MEVFIRKLKLIHKNSEFMPVVLSASKIEIVEALITSGNWLVKVPLHKFPYNEKKHFDVSWLHILIPSGAILSPEGTDYKEILDTQPDYSAIEFHDDYGLICTFILPWLGEDDINHGITIKDGKNGSLDFEVGFQIV